MPAKTLPTILTQADWNRQKGVIAKMAGETGIGAAMLAVATEWNKVDWNDLDPNLAYAKTGKQRTPENHALLTEVARGERGKVEAVRTKLKALRDLAKATETKFKASKVIPSSSRAHVGNIATAADHLFIGLKTVDVIDVPWENERKIVVKENHEKLVKASADIKKFLKATTDRALMFVQKVKADPKPATFNSGIVKAARDMTQHIGNVPKFLAAGIELDLQPRPDLFQTLMPWADARKSLEPTAPATEVVVEINKFEVATRAVKSWAGV